VARIWHAGGRGVAVDLVQLARWQSRHHRKPVAIAVFGSGTRTRAGWPECAPPGPGKRLDIGVQSGGPSPPDRRRVGLLVRGHSSGALT
jgi:hypothetical protein